MSTKLLRWKVQPEPTGRYRSFERRGWPDACYAKHPNLIAVSLSCPDDYTPAKARSGNHQQITIRIADYSTPSNKETQRGFTWRTLKMRAWTLDDVKRYAETFLLAHSEFQPKGDDNA